MVRPRGTLSTQSAPKKRALTDAEIEKALRQVGGWHSLAAKKLGYSRGYISERVGLSPRLKAVISEIEDHWLDRAEDKLQQHIHDSNNLIANIFYLKTKGRRRGYSENQETNQLTETARELVNEIKRSKLEDQSDDILSIS